MPKPSLLSMLVLALAALAVVPALPAQSKPGTQQISLPIVVRDKKGALVANPQKSDLTLTQDSRPQTIDSLTRDEQRVRIGLIIQTSSAMSGALESQRKAAEDFLAQFLPDGTKNQAFLIHFDREVELLQDFTSSREKLNNEFDQMGSTSGHREETGPETTGDDRADDRASRRRGNTQLYDAIYLASDELMKNKDGHKVLVVFSTGADHGSKETMNDAVDAADRARLSIYTIFFKGEQERGYGSSNFPGSGRHGGPPGGGGGGWPGSGGGGRRQPEPTSATGIDGKKIMGEIAQRTGGHAYQAKKTSDFDPIFKLIGEELGSVVVLTYSPDKPDNDGNFHKVALTPANQDWSIAAPEGYYAPEK